MARATRKKSLETPTARTKFAKGRWYSVNIGRGVALAYRRRGPAAGSWFARIAQEDNRYSYRRIGEADDYQDPNGITVLSYFEAQEKAREAAKAHVRGLSTYTVRQALADYFKNYPGRQASVPRIQASVEPHILSALGDRPVNALTTGELETWREALVAAPARIRGETCTRAIPEDEDELAEYIRGRKATANRILGVLRAALNRAWRTHEDIPSNSDWMKVRPYRAVARGRVNYLETTEARKLIAECLPDLRALVRGALLSGARPGELRQIRVEDYDRKHATIYIRKSKVDGSRHVPLNAEGYEFFDRLTAGRDGAEWMFLRADGSPWAKDDPRRPLSEACHRAKLKPINLYALRHSFATLLLAENVSMHYLAKIMGTSVKMIEDHYGHIVEEFQRETMAKLPSFGLDDSKVTRIA